MSYYCLPNMSSVISSKNKQLLKGDQNQPPPCECKNGHCPIDGKCKARGIIYQAVIQTQNNETHSYVGLSEKSFLERYTQHISSFQVHDKRNSTSLSKKVKELQRKHILFDITWKILEISTPYRAGCQECCLCVTEIYHILFSPAFSTLNSRSEFTNKCRHQNKFKLSSI